MFHKFQNKKRGFYIFVFTTILQTGKYPVLVSLP